MNYDGKHLCLELAPITKVAQAQIKDGKINVTRAFSIDTGQYIAGNTINGVAVLVKAISAELLAHKVSTKKIMLCSAILGIDTELTPQSDVNAQPWYKQDIKELLGGHKKSALDAHRLVKEINLGKCDISGTQQVMTLCTSIDKELSGLIRSTFAQQGFEVISIEDTHSAALSFRALLTHSYDENGKVIVNIGNAAATAYWCAGDIPADIKTWQLDVTEDIAYQLDSYLSRDIATYRFRHPKVLIMSDKPIKYAEILNQLKANDFNVFDLGDIITSESGVTPDYFLPLGLLMKVYYKKNINLLCKKKQATDIQRLKSLRVCTAAATLVLCASLGFLGMKGYDYIKQANMIKQGQNHTALESKEAMLNAQRIYMDKLELVNTKICDLARFSASTSGIFIASIDTAEMLAQIATLPQDETVADKLLTDEPPPAPEELPQENKLFIRGYSENANLIVSFFNAMKAQGVCNQYLLNGIEKIPDTLVYAFEIEVSLYECVS